MSEAPDYIAISIDSDGTASVETAYFGSCHIYAHDRILAAKDAEIAFLTAQLEAFQDMAPPPKPGLLRKRLAERRLDNDEKMTLGISEGTKRQAMSEAPFLQGAKVETMWRDFQKHREAIRAHDTFAAEETWEKCERWVDQLRPETAGPLAAKDAEIERLRQEVSDLEALSDLSSARDNSERREDE